MSRTAQILNRIELIAKKWEMDIEHVVDVLEGKHPKLSVHTAPGPNAPATIAANAAAGSQVSSIAGATSSQGAAVNAAAEVKPDPNASTGLAAASVAGTGNGAAADTASTDAAAKAALENEENAGAGTN